MMKRMLKNHLLSSVVILSSVLWGGTAFADNVRNNIESFELDPVLVTATRYETRDLEIPAATEIFDQKKIEKLGANNVMEVVRNIPGFTLTASPTGNTYVGFRGVSKDNVAILVNGIPLNQDGNYDLESISTDIIDRIEVVKGGSAVLYGSNASAGVINIITNKKQGTNLKGQSMSLQINCKSAIAGNNQKAAEKFINRVRQAFIWVTILKKTV